MMGDEKNSHPELKEKNEKKNREKCVYLLL